MSLAEILCRLLCPTPAATTPSGFVIADPDLIWRLDPSNLINELGLCDTPYQADADVKILLLGDSVSWGQGVDMLAAFPHRLERYLADAQQGTTFEVINAAVPGYSTFQQAKYLELHGLDLQPDMVILQFCLNDVVERYHILAQYGGDNIFLGIDTRMSVRGVYGLFMRNCRAFEVLHAYLRSRSQRRDEYDVTKLARDTLSRELQQAWQRALNEVDTIRELTQRQGRPFLLLIVPYRFQLDAPTTLRQPQDRLIEYAGSKKVPFFDLLAAFARVGQSHPQLHSQLFLDANHLSAVGHDVTAQLLIRPVLDNLAGN